VGGHEAHPFNLIMVLANIFQPLIDIFGPVLVFFHSIIGGSVAPQMKAIQAKYKDDKQRRQQEITKFYDEFVG
jgi:hypothetical protein